MEKYIPRQELPPTYTVSLKEAWDTQSEAEVFIEQLRKVGVYQEDLLFCGFDGTQIGTSFASAEHENIIFCSQERELSVGRGNYDGGQNALRFAQEYEVPMVALYDAKKMEKRLETTHGYTIKDPSALIGYVRLTF